jgi:hypothetical protein
MREQSIWGWLVSSVVVMGGEGEREWDECWVELGIGGNEGSSRLDMED